MRRANPKIDYNQFLSEEQMVSTEKAYAMLGNESLWEVALHCNRVFKSANIPHSICGGVAVCLHGYQRNTTDIDIIICGSDSAKVRELLTASHYTWDEDRKEFSSPSGVAVQFLIAGDRAGRDLDISIPAPEGDLNVEERDGLSVIRLSRLIEMKIACGLGNMRRTYKDFADVVELIAIRDLDGSFCRFLHKSVRETFRELVHRAKGESQ